MEFAATIDSDFRMAFAEHEIRTAAATIVANKSNKVCRYTLIHMEFMDSKPEDITVDLITRVQQNWEDKNNPKLILEN